MEKSKVFIIVEKLKHLHRVRELLYLTDFITSEERQFLIDESNEDGEFIDSAIKDYDGWGFDKIEEEIMGLIHDLRYV